MKVTARLFSALAGLCVILPSVRAGVYTYNASVSDWFTASDNLPAFTKYVVKGAGSPSQTFYVTDDLNKIEVRSEQPNTSANAVGTYAGASWIAPAGEQITSITFTYQSVLNSALQLSLYVGAGNSDTKLNGISPSTTQDNRSSGTSLTWTVPEGVVATQLEFRNWDLTASAGVATTWRSSIVSVSITTAPYTPDIPEPAAWTALAGVTGLVAAIRFRRRRANT